MTVQAGLTPLQRAIAAALEASPKPRDFYDRQLQLALGTKGKPLYDIQRGKSKNPSKATLEAIEEVFALPPGALHTTNYDELAERIRPRVEPSPKHFDHDRSKDVGLENPIMLRRVDVRYAMGPGTQIEDYPESEPFEFDRGHFRKLTYSSPDLCVIVNGHGDSNMPTIMDYDDLLIDMGRRVLNERDKFWAISIYGSGAVKRLRAVGPDRILVMSDNKAVAPDEEYPAEDIYIVGRVIWCGRRM